MSPGGGGGSQSFFNAKLQGSMQSNLRTEPSILCSLQAAQKVCTGGLASKMGLSVEVEEQEGKWNGTLNRRKARRSIRVFEVMWPARNLYLLTYTTENYLQLDCSLVTHWDPCHNSCCRGPILIPSPVLESPVQTTRANVLDFFVKPKNGISVSYTKRH